jgi:hypothetical protein
MLRQQHYSDPNEEAVRVSCKAHLKVSSGKSLITYPRGYEAARSLLVILLRVLLLLVRCYESR